MKHISYYWEKYKKSTKIVNRTIQSVSAFNLRHIPYKKNPIEFPILHSSLNKVKTHKTFKP